LRLFTDCSTDFEDFGGNACEHELVTVVVTVDKPFELDLLVAHGTFTLAGIDEAIVDETFGVDCEEGVTVDETRADVYVARG
jgi:hypothetical protein